jgi:NAD(P)-dependent dehydrogenase (short-subunit alcohol dehydrogenase family)
MGRLEGKHALITGGTSGIGLETAREFLAEGATIAVTGRSQEKLDDVAKQLDGPLHTFLSDAGDVPGQAVLASQLQAAFPKLDILMSNAADVTHLPIEQWSEEAYDRVIATNLKAPFFLIKALLPLFSKQTSIILVGSVSTFVGHENAAVYGAAKAGLLSYSRGLTYELKDRGIRINGLSPGPDCNQRACATRRRGPGCHLQGNAARHPCASDGHRHGTGEGRCLSRLRRVSFHRRDRAARRWRYRRARILSVGKAGNGRRRETCVFS